MNNQELSKYLSTLGYTVKWLEYGLLTKNYLLIQTDIYNQGDDKNTEHYRYATFRNYLETKDTLTDLEFDHYIELALCDKALVMAGSALMDLFTKTSLSNHQFDMLITVMKGLGEWANNTILRQTLLRQLKQEVLTDELFRECVEKGDKVVHEYLLGIADPNQLSFLALNGRTKKIKTLATQSLKNLTGKQF